MKEKIIKETKASEKIRKQIDNGFKIAQKWKQQRKTEEIIDKVLFDEQQEE